MLKNIGPSLATYNEWIKKGCMPAGGDRKTIAPFSSIHTIISVLRVKSKSENFM